MQIKIKRAKMKLQIEKLGKIKEAEIKFSGLTLIAGKNDTGKSTRQSNVCVGKKYYKLGISL